MLLFYQCKMTKTAVQNNYWGFGRLNKWLKAPLQPACIPTLALG